MFPPRPAAEGGGEDMANSTCSGGSIRRVYQVVAQLGNMVASRVCFRYERRPAPHALGRMVGALSGSRNAAVCGAGERFYEMTPPHPLQRAHMLPSGGISDTRASVGWNSRRAEACTAYRGACIKVPIAVYGCVVSYPAVYAVEAV